ncbi:PhzF family phenazine biosynthesis protein [Pseudahrensia aquimaris]|uniref:PhzF family phenazine biosynthesis protein n=1 Tax=Pseudahrensia aquimaris TaxID=744461 RepID=A0ABW3FLS1_9HYPH
MTRRFAIFDVFAEQKAGGNQLAVVYDSEGLDSDAMQTIATEFGFSETVFLAEPENGAHSARVRIFTPKNELPFAGHPTVGAAVAVAREQGIDTLGQGIVVLEENVGPMRCGVRFDEAGAFAEFDLPKIAKRLVPPGDKEKAALALGLDVADIGFENHLLSSFDGGLPYELVPVKDLDAAARAAPNMVYWRDAFGTHSHNCAYVYCRDTVGHENQFHARMFAPDSGIPEDPATGSAVSSFARAVALFDDLPDGLHSFRIEQGIEMGRPSVIQLEIDMEDGAMSGGRIGGMVRLFANGELVD